MDIVSKKLEALAHYFRTNTYEDVETERFECKTLAKGWGEDFHKTVCAFLNTDGGIILIGIKEKNNAKPPHYVFTGYDNIMKNEHYLNQELHKKFQDIEGNLLNIDDCLSFEIRDFQDGKVAVIYVEALSDERKYAFYKGAAYRRRLTSEYAIDKKEIEIHEEAKKEIIQYQELALVSNTSIEDIDLDIVNDFIREHYNKGKKRGETLKKDLEDAKKFLSERHFLREGQLTILGALMCGKDAEKLQGKAKVDCYVIIPKTRNIAEAREIIEDNITALIERSYNFVWRYISVGISYVNGGSALPEYPQELLRESINNAFAHRDYKSTRPIIIEIFPMQKLEIRNPGQFSRMQRIYEDTEHGKIRRIIPLQIARNPKLAHLLQNYRYWEGKGHGLSSLIDACLLNEIDLPYYILSLDEIKLVIPKGKIYDETARLWLNSFQGYIREKMGRELSEEERILLAIFKKSEEQNRLERYTILITTNNNHTNAIAALEDKGLIFKNPISTELYPVYQVDRLLMQTDFSAELQAIFGAVWRNLKDEYRKALNAIYLHQYFNADVAISANSIGTFLYFGDYQKTNDLKDFENKKRKIRLVFNELETGKFIIKKSDEKKLGYLINENFRKESNLFE